MRKFMCIKASDNGFDGAPEVGKVYNANYTWGFKTHTIGQLVDEGHDESYTFQQVQESPKELNLAEKIGKVMDELGKRGIERVGFQRIGGVCEGMQINFKDKDTEGQVICQLLIREDNQHARVYFMGNGKKADYWEDVFAEFLPKKKEPVYINSAGEKFFEEDLDGVTKTWYYDHKTNKVVNSAIKKADYLRERFSCSESFKTKKNLLLYLAGLE